MIIRPQEGPQEIFMSTPADIAIYGGAAGGGKSYSLLMEPIRHINNGRFGAVIFRRNSTQIMTEGGLWDTSYELYPGLGAISIKTPMARWAFPSGAKVTFSHLQLEETVLSWQGSQIALLGFDELTHFTRSQFFYMLSRNRTTCGIKPYVRATCNPDADSWVADFISWWIDQETGYPIPERSGKIRWMIRLDDIVYWGDSKQELIDRFDLKGIDQAAPKSVTFIASKLTDNKILMMADPGYMANLQALPLVEKERLLNGNWKIRPAAGLIFPRSKAEIIEELPNDVSVWVRSWDMAATEDIKAEKKNDNGPAKTAGVLIGKRRCGRYVIANVINRAMSASDVRKTIKSTAVIDKKKYKRVKIRLSQDPGQAGKDQAEQYIKMLSGFNVCAKRESGSKEIRAEGLAAQWQAGNVDVMNAEWTEEYLSQMDAFPEAFFKDMVDASSNGFNEIEESNTIIPSAAAASANRTNQWRV
ncbi:phage terminase large subunit [Eubacterium maltosivorans]|uniref:phage terminase large subunit n=1 Tax=Eubacterium maltosivorans TaxID=2041044 RepID=UPI00189E0B9A|nr:phage terminase large subunit [Eubacterium maltosivorans]